MSRRSLGKFIIRGFGSCNYRLPKTHGPCPPPVGSVLLMSESRTELECTIIWSEIDVYWAYCTVCHAFVNAFSCLQCAWFQLWFGRFTWSLPSLTILWYRYSYWNRSLQVEIVDILFLTLLFIVAYLTRLFCLDNWTAVLSLVWSTYSVDLGVTGCLIDVLVEY